jgi:hypothetical protein
MFSKSVIVSLICILLTGLVQAQEWRPERTHAVVVGVLQWQAPGVPSFSAEGRQDVELLRTLVARGVPEENIISLFDSEATLSNILQALQEKAAQAAPGDTLLFYYAGHGVKRAGSAVQFANYDWTPEYALEMPAISQALEGTQGARVVLMGDCCYSGALKDVAASLGARGNKAVSLTSATDLVPSNPDWTFTMSVLEALKGKRTADQDNNHRITLSEAAATVTENMKYYERQNAGFYNAGVDDDLVLAYVTTIEPRPLLPLPFRPYEWVQFQNQKRWEPARLVSYDGERYGAQIQRYSSRPVLSVTREDLWNFPPRPQPLPQEEALKRATVDGKYSGLLRKLSSELDYLAVTGFRDLGRTGFTEYFGYKNLPQGYWVYVYPYWYIWEREVSAE